MKTCKKCHQEKGLEDFYRHPDMKDGRVNTCRPCTRKHQKAKYKPRPAAPSDPWALGIDKL